MTKKPETDAEMAAIRVSGTVTPLNAQIYLAPYDPTWPAQYAGEAAKIRAALGDNALVLEHVGSTSLPGLPAKPIIDILLAVADSSDEDAYVPALTARGYRLHLREPDWEQHRVMKVIGVHAGQALADRVFPDNNGLCANVVRYGTPLPGRGVKLGDRPVIFDEASELRGIQALKILPLKSGDRGGQCIQTRSCRH